MAKKRKAVKRKIDKKAKTKKIKRVSFVPAGYHTLTPYLSVHDGKAAVEYYTKAFGAKEKPGRMSDENGKIMHTELKIGVSHFMLADENIEWGNLSPKTVGKTTIQLMIYVKDADTVMANAVKAGGTMVAPVELQFYGDRSGRVNDPFGYTWFISTHVENVSPKEMARRVKELYGGTGA